MTGKIFQSIVIFFGVIIVLIILIFGYLFFEPFLTETEETITVVNMEKWSGEHSKYFIFTKNEVFLNADNYYQDKHNSDKLYPKFKKGYTYKVKIVGLYIPFIPRFRNIIEILEVHSKDYTPMEEF